MSRLRILITNNTLARRAGTELYVRDIATALLARGHAPVVYSQVLGEVADELRMATVPVVDDLAMLGEPPDIIHGQHHFETMTALLQFPETPAIYLCHGWLPWEEAPPRFPRIRQYLAVDDTCRDRMVFQHGFSEASIQVLPNFVDFDRFPARLPLPSHPQRALVFSNYAREENYLPAVREACRGAGLALDVMGLGEGNAATDPGQVLGQYDLVFATGRSALEAMAVGAAVVLCSHVGVGPMVTMANFDRLRRLNFGIRNLTAPVEPASLEREIARYDAADAAAVSARIRVEAGRDATIDQLLALYGSVIDESAAEGAHDADAELRAASAYLRSLAPRVKGAEGIQQENARLAAELQWLRASPLFRLRERLLRVPGLQQGYRALRGSDREDAKKKSMP